MNSENIKKWIKCAGLRALRTLIQTAAASLGTTVALSEVDFELVAVTSVLAAVLSLLNSIPGLPELEYADDETGGDVG